MGYAHAALVDHRAREPGASAPLHPHRTHAGGVRHTPPTGHKAIDRAEQLWAFYSFQIPLLGRYAFNVLLAIDQLLNAILGGYPDESISARAYRQRSNPFWQQVQLLIDLLFFWDADHCEKAYWAERNSSHLPDEYENSSLDPQGR